MIDECPCGESASDPCPCPGGLSGQFLQPCLLLILNHEALYGCVLMDRLQQLGAPAHASAVYRMLRRMEEEGLVVSEWNAGGIGTCCGQCQLDE